MESNWTLDRLGKFTASAITPLLAPKGFGQGAMTYIFEKVAETLRGEAVKPDISNLWAVQWGNENEPLAAARYLKGKTGVYYGKENPKFFAFGDYAGASPDGLVGEDGMFEIKCPDSHTHVKYGVIGGADHDDQVQMGLLCTGREWCDFISFDPRMVREEMQMFVHRIPRNEDRIALIKERIEMAVAEKKKIIQMLMRNPQSYE